MINLVQDSLLVSPSLSVGPAVGKHVPVTLGIRTEVAAVAAAQRWLSKSSINKSVIIIALSRCHGRLSLDISGMSG